MEYRACARWVIVTAGLLALAVPRGPAGAQSSSEKDSLADAPTRPTPAMRQKVSTPLIAAQECSESGDLECAQRELERVRAMTDLNSYETAQMWYFYAYIAFEQDDYPAAIEAFENVLAEPGITVGLETTTLYSLATLYVQQDQYSLALERLERWFALEPSPSVDPYMLKAQILYQLERFDAAIEPLLRALDIAADQGREPQEGWYQLLSVIYFQLENFPKVIEATTFLAEHWTKPEYIKQLAGMYSQIGQDQQTLALYEAAYDAGWLTGGPDLVTLASLLLGAEIPYKAARVLEAGLESGMIESTRANWRLLGQAWQIAQEDEKALPGFKHASGLSSDGNLDMLLAQTYANLGRWEECIESAREALRRGELDREDQNYIVLGNCLLETMEFDAARKAFQTAARDERSRSTAENWLAYLNSEESRVIALRDMVRVR
jgi:tetratricopeptide (TPR) repeat protein